MTFWGGSGSGSGSADPCLWLMHPDLGSDPDPDADLDPAIFVIDLNKMPTKKFFCLLLFERTCTSFSKIKSKKNSQSFRNQGFSYFFYLVIEGSRSGSGSIPLTDGSGSGSRRPKNMWIRWIRDPDSDPDPQHCPLVDNIAGNACTHLSISLSLVFCKVGKFPLVFLTLVI